MATGCPFSKDISCCQGLLSFSAYFIVKVYFPVAIDKNYGVNMSIIEIHLAHL